MIDLQLNFYRWGDKEAICVATTLAAVPRFGDRVHFVDADHDLRGVVHSVLYTDINGESFIVVGINQE